jgi:ribose/xylose/arabinose/galactoside ABC-type transport system permease subunit
MLIVLVGDFDMGLGYAVGLANVLSATVLVSEPLLGVLSLVGLVAAYVLMGLVAEVSNVPAIVVTLGASFLWLGIGLMIQPSPGGSVPGWLESIANRSLPIVPEPVYILVGIAVVMWWLVRRSRTGLRLRALGNSRQSLDHSGWSARRTRLVAYALAGLCVVLAGLMTTAFSLSSDENASSTLTLSAFVILILGGCQFGVGRVEPVGVVAAAAFLTLLTSLLAFYHVGSIYTTGTEGVILVAAVAGPWLIRALPRPKGRFFRADPDVR